VDGRRGGRFTRTRPSVLYATNTATTTGLSANVSTFFAGGVLIGRLTRCRAFYGRHDCRTRYSSSRRTPDDITFPRTQRLSRSPSRKPKSTASLWLGTAKPFTIPGLHAFACMMDRPYIIHIYIHRGVRAARNVVGRERRRRLFTVSIPFGRYANAPPPVRLADR